MMRNRDLRFSVVVPAYNCEKHIGECIESILSQDYPEFQLIIVNDGSTDNTFDICKKYANNESRLTLINKMNGGPFSARKEAYSYLKSDYTIHVDADDVLAPWALSRLASAIASSSADIIFYEISKDSDFLENEHRFPFTNNSYFGPETKYKFLNLVFSPSFCLNSMCSKAIRTELLRSVSYPLNMEGMISGEDLLQSIYILKEAESAYYIEDALYYYRENSAGTTNTFRNSDLSDYEIFYEDFRCLLDNLSSIPGFKLRNVDNDHSLIFGCFRYLQNASRHSSTAFFDSASLVRNSANLVTALSNVPAKKGLRPDAVFVLNCVLGKHDRLAYVFLNLENRLRS